MVQAHPIRSPRWAAVRGDVAGEEIRSVGCLPSPSGREPQRRREMVEGDDRQDPPTPAGGADAPVMLERGERELPFRRLDPAPLEREAVGRQTELGDQVDVLGPAVERVTGIAARRHRARVRVVLPGPPVVVDVAALDLVGRRGHTPGEPSGKTRRPGGALSCPLPMPPHGSGPGRRALDDVGSRGLR